MVVLPTPPLTEVTTTTRSVGPDNSGAVQVSWWCTSGAHLIRGSVRWRGSRRARSGTPSAGERAWGAPR
jgi:hypothetical protein